jgi:ubiquinone/menaquinone biosynthesis C-methylase UbiE
VLVQTPDPIFLGLSRMSDIKVSESDESYKNAAASVWNASPAGSTFGSDTSIGSVEFFEKVKEKRSSYEQPWLYKIIPFVEYQNRTVLELGCGAGFDAFEFCQKGALYTGIDIASLNPVRTRQHLSFFQYFPRLMQADAEALPFVSESYEVVYSNGVLHHTPDIKRAFSETYRVLKSGGEFWVILYNRNSIFYIFHTVLFGYIAKGNYKTMRLDEYRSQIEYTTSSEKPLVNVYSSRDVKFLLQQSGFKVQNIWIRKLVHNDIPALPVLQKLWRRIPQSWLDIAGHYFGWYIIAKGRKP